MGAVADSSTARARQGLPPPRAARLDRPLEALRRSARALARRTLGSADVLLLTRTGARVDTGLWLLRPRVVLACLRDRLVLLAPGRRSYVETVEFSRLRESLYNHVTGRLVLAPAENVRITAIRVSPRKGYQILAQIYSEVHNDA